MPHKFANASWATYLANTDIRWNEISANFTAIGIQMESIVNTSNKVWGMYLEIIFKKADGCIMVTEEKGERPM
jgi:hypothetical protein